MEPETEYQVWVEARTKNDVPSRSEEVKVTTFTQINLPEVTEKTPRYNMKDHRSKGGFYAKFSFKITVNFLLTGKLRKKTVEALGFCYFLFTSKLPPTIDPRKRSWTTDFQALSNLVFSFIPFQESQDQMDGPRDKGHTTTSADLLPCQPVQQQHSCRNRKSELPLLNRPETYSTVPSLQSRPRRPLARDQV